MVRHTEFWPWLLSDAKPKYDTPQRENLFSFCSIFCFVSISKILALVIEQTIFHLNRSLILLIAELNHLRWLQRHFEIEFDVVQRLRVIHLEKKFLSRQPKTYTDMKIQEDIVSPLALESSRSETPAVYIMDANKALTQKDTTIRGFLASTRTEKNENKRMTIQQFLREQSTYLLYKAAAQRVGQPHTGYCISHREMLVQHYLFDRSIQNVLLHLLQKGVTYLSCNPLSPNIRCKDTWATLWVDRSIGSYGKRGLLHNTLIQKMRTQKSTPQT